MLAIGQSWRDRLEGFGVFQRPNGGPAVIAGAPTRLGARSRFFGALFRTAEQALLANPPVNPNQDRGRRDRIR